MSFSTTSAGWLALTALAVASAALLVAISSWRRGRSLVGSGRSVIGRGKRDPAAPLSTDEVTAQIEALQASASSSLRHLAVVRYDAFGDMGGHLSWSMALLDDSGDGVVLTSIHGRSDSRTYAKNVAAWTASQQLSPEEEEAIGFARTASP